MASESYNNLVSAWRSVRFDKEPPYILPGDESYLSNHKRDLATKYYDFEGFIKNEEHGREHGGLFHLGVLPDPYVGDLLKAKVFILLGNPGFTPLDYYSQSSSSDFRATKIRNIRQEHGNTPYPNPYLDPKFCWHGGGRYWLEKFSEILKRSEASYLETLQLLAREVAILESLPYHSVNMSHASKIESKLRSVELVRRFVQEDLSKRASAGEILILCLRRKWGFNQSKKNIVVSEQPRGAHLTPSTEEGRRLIEFLQIRLKPKKNKKA